MRIEITFTQPETKKILERIYSENLISPDVIKDEVHRLFSEEGDVESGTILAKEINLSIPKGWYELSMKKAVEVGDFINAAESSEELDRDLTQKEIMSMIEVVILKGDMISLCNIENFSSKVFHLAVWQNILAIRVARRLWENRYEENSPRSNLLDFHKDFKEVFSEFSIESRHEIVFALLKKSFRLFNNATMSQIVFAQSQLGDNKFVRNLSQKIMRCSPCY